MSERLIIDTTLDHQGYNEIPKVVYERYLKDLDVHELNLFQKKILDIGAGSAGFAKHIQDSQLETDVVSVDRNFPSDTKSLKGYIVAKAQLLPFENETFDYVFSMNALPHVAADSSQRKGADFKMNVARSRADAVADCLRVLKKDGEIRFGGIPSEYPHQLEGWEDGLKEYEVEVENLIDSKGLLIIRKI